MFLAFAFGISWLSAAILYFSGVEYGTFLSSAIVAVAFMGAPAIAAMIVQKGIYKEPIRSMGLDLKKTKGLRFFWIPAVYAGFCFLWLGIIALFGNVFHLNAFGSITFDESSLLQNINDVSGAMGGAQLSKLPIPPLVMFFVQLISSMLVGAIVNTIFTLGEELGWRGFLFNETRSMGFVKSNILIGAIWGLWHAPLILQGHNYPEHPVAGVLMMVVFCVPLGFVMSYLRTKTNSVLAPAVFHAMINAMGGNLMLYATKGNDLVYSVAGFAGAFAFLILFVVILLVDRKTVTSFSEPAPPLS